MADAAARSLQYEYKANSNLVLQADTRLIEKRGRDESTGEVLSLSGKLTGTKMGDRAIRTKPSAEDDEKGAATKRKKSSSQRPQKRRRNDKEFGFLSGRQSVLTEDLDALASVYKPKTAETRQTYEVLLSFIQEALGDQPRDVLQGAVDEILRTLKNGEMRDSEKKRDTQELLGTPITEERFALLVNLGKKITDYGKDDGANGNDDIDETYGINVQFQESDEEDDDNMGDDDDKDDQDEDEDVQEKGAIKAEASGDRWGKSDRGDGATSQGSLHPLEIDAHWLQRKLSKYFSDATTSQQKSKEVLSILESAADNRECENKLVLLLGYDCFDFIKLLLQNKKTIVYCIKLLKCKDEDEREIVKSAMRRSRELAPILAILEGEENEDLKAGGGSSGMDKSDKKTIQQSKEEEEEIGPEMLSLEELAFENGSHFMTNKRCELPEGSTRKQQKGYEEVEVPAAKPKEMSDNEKNVAIEDLPAYAQPAFKGFKSLNRIQSQLKSACLESNENLLLCAPTGAGKTNVALLTILKEISKHVDPETGLIRADEFKIVYVAPMKSLVQEMVGNFTKRLESYKIKVGELTGDSQMSKEQIAETQVISHGVMFSLKFESCICQRQ